MEFWRQRLLATINQQLPEPEQKAFNPKFNLPKLANYREDPGPEFWEKFPKSKTIPGKSLVSPVELFKLARKYGLDASQEVEAALRDLREGARIGCRGEARQPTISSNAESCFDFPEEITDSVATMVARRIAAGPFEKDEVPASAKINGMMCRIKPNGSCRIILNLSAPIGLSVNDGIDSDEFPTLMSSTGKWVECLNRAGRGCLMAKMDWEIAYKHIHVHPDDLNLQWFHWLGRYFVELSLIFGSASSPGIYDRLAKIVLQIAIRSSGFNKKQVCQYLDDVCAAAQPSARPGVADFRNAYMEVARQVGIKMSPEDDPEKAFGPRTQGTVLGVAYNTIDWTWAIPTEKLARLVQQIDTALRAEKMTQRDIWSLVGKIIHYCPLIQSGRFNIVHLIKLNSASSVKSHKSDIPPEAKRQLWFWRTILLATNGGASIPVLPEVTPAWAIEFYTDAAGGSRHSPGLGCGGVSPGWWFFLHWGKEINGETVFEGRRLGQKLSALELVGPLVCVSSNIEKIRNRPIRIFVDNSGSVNIWRKGYSTSCSLCTTLVTAIADVAASIGCRVAIEKVPRCSTMGATMADALSKSAFKRFREADALNSWALPPEPQRIPTAILKWVEHPRADPDLGSKILCDLRQAHLVLGYNC